jgi:hypothetical protein
LIHAIPVRRDGGFQPPCRERAVGVSTVVFQPRAGADAATSPSAIFSSPSRPVAGQPRCLADRRRDGGISRRRRDRAAVCRVVLGGPQGVARAAALVRGASRSCNHEGDPRRDVQSERRGVRVTYATRRTRGERFSRAMHGAPWMTNPVGPGSPPQARAPARVCGNCAPPVMRPRPPRWTPKTGQSWTPENRPVR